MVDFAYIDTCGSTIWLLPIFGKVTGTLKLSVKIRGAVICGGYAVFSANFHITGTWA